MGLCVEVQYTGDWWGEDPLTETAHETTGSLFRSLAGMPPKAGEPRRPWEALGRCTGKVYVDVPGSPCSLCGKAKAEHAEKPVYVETGDKAWLRDPSQHRYQAEPRQIGWVFVARNPEPVNRGDTQPTGLREAWVTVHDAPPTVTRTAHYHSFR